MSWIKEKLWELNDVFEEFPKVYWCTMFYITLTIIAGFLYEPLFNTIANINLLGVMPFKQMIAENWNVLQWGAIVAPLVILLNGWIHTVDLYERLARKRYGYR